MQLSVFVSSIGRRLGFRTGAGNTLETEILENAGLAQEELQTELVKTKPWFLLSEYAQEPTVASEERVALPVDFLSELERGELWIIDSAEGRAELTKGAYDAFARTYTGEGKPEAYSMHGGYFRLHPTPDDIYTLRMFYFQKATAIPATLTGNETFENQWMANAPNCLVAATGLRTARDIQHGVAEAGYQDALTKALFDLHVQVIARITANDTLGREDVV